MRHKSARKAPCNNAVACRACCGKHEVHSLACAPFALHDFQPCVCVFMYGRPCSVPGQVLVSQAAVASSSIFGALVAKIED